MNIAALLGYVSALRIKHWNADTKSNEHKAIGELYEALDGLLDDYVETFLGKTGGTVEEGLESCECEDNSSLISKGRELVAEQRDALSVGDDDDLLNILADMDGSLNKAAYLLKAAPSAASEKPETFDDEGME